MTKDEGVFGDHNLLNRISGRRNNEDKSLACDTCIHASYRDHERIDCHKLGFSVNFTKNYACDQYAKSTVVSEANSLSTSLKEAYKYATSINMAVDQINKLVERILVDVAEMTKVVNAVETKYKQEEEERKIR